MNTFQHKTLLFFICIGVRILLSFCFQYIPKSLSSYMSIIPLCISIGFIVVWGFKLRQKKGSFNNEIWWDPLRIVHAFLYSVASWFLFTEKQYLASTIVLIDTGIGMLAYFWHYYTNQKLMELWNM